MVNLSSRNLYKLERQVLNLGLGFVPTPWYNPFRDHIDLYKLIRMLKLKRFFESEERTESCPFKMASTFIPNINNPSIKVFEKLVLKDLKLLDSQNIKTRYNLNHEQTLVLKRLNEDKSVVTKPADKGGVIVILDHKDNEAEAYRKLQDEKAYTKIQRDPMASIKYLIRIMVLEAMALKYINQELANFFINEYPRIPLFYLLPKMHKPRFPSKSKLIVTAQDCLLTNISKFSKESSKEQVISLDMMVFRTQNGTLAVKPYVKETGKNTYMHFGFLIHSI